MDVTSLLNRPAGTKEEVGQDAGNQTPELQALSATAPWEGLPTPSPEHSPPRVLVDCRAGTKSRTPWDAGGYSLPLSLDTKFYPTDTRPAIYGGDPLDISSASAHSAVTPLSFHSRTASLESSPAEMIPSALVSPMTTSRPLIPSFLGEPTSQLEISTSRRDSCDSDADAQLTARRPSFHYHHTPISPAGSPKSPRHKLSDSHSSLSSYTPSSQSGGHSRISSFSTVGIVPSASRGSISEIPCIEENSEGNEAIQWNRMPIFGGSRPPSPGLVQFRNGSPFRLGALNGDGPRPRSPSDAFLIARRAAHRPSLDQSHLLSQPLENVDEDHLQDRLNPLPNSIPRTRQTRSPIHKHKRAISAPNFAHFRNSHLAYSNRLHLLPEPLPQAFTRPCLNTTSSFTRPGLYAMSSDGNSNDSQEPGGDKSAPNLPGLPLPTTTAAPAVGDGNLGVSCEKDPNCDTGASLRKLISHFFGRNKKCTRSIPAHVWVHWCRKHYQRERYNKNTGYAMTQADLLVIQLRRIRDWSDENERKSETSGVVQSWELRLRKREANRRRGLSNAEANSDEDEDGESGWVPEWLSVQLGDGYKTEQIQGMVERLHEEVHTGVLHKMPDIEFLPSISGDVPRRAPRSRAPTSHRRTQSQGVSPAASAMAGPSNTLAVAGTSHASAASGRPNIPASAATLSTTLGEFIPARRPSRRGSQQAVNETGQPPRAEKRKAGETLEASMTPPSARRTALTHRPAYTQAARANTHPRVVDNSMPSGHSRSRSDMSHLESNYDRWSGRIMPDRGRDIRSGDTQMTFHTSSLYPGHPMVEFSERQGHSRRISTPGSYHYSQGNTNTNSLTLGSTLSYETPRLTLGMGGQRRSSGVTLPPISALAGEDCPPMPLVGLSAGDAPREGYVWAGPPRDISRGRSRGPHDGGYRQHDNAAEDKNGGDRDSGY